jgi:hypothetical protein
MVEVEDSEVRVAPYVRITLDFVSDSAFSSMLAVSGVDMLGSSSSSRSPATLDMVEFRVSLLDAPRAAVALIEEISTVWSSCLSLEPFERDQYE